MTSSNTDFIAVPKRIGRKRKKPAASTPALTLTSATYDHEVPSVTLTFDRDINTDDMVLSSIVLADGQYLNEIYAAYTTTGTTSNSVTVELAKISGTPGAGVKLDVGSDNGIVSVDGGDAWAGVTGLALPFSV